MTMNKEAKHTLIFVVVLMGAFLLVNWLFGKISNGLLASLPPSSNEVARMNYQITQSKSECLILCSSRASHHYNPSILQDSLGLTTYNAGRNGHGISYADGVLRAVLGREKPKLIILEFSDGEFRPDWTEKISSLKPYYHTYPQVLQLAKTILGEKEGLKSMFSSYRFNSLMFPILGTYLHSSTDNKKGFMPLKGQNDKNMKMRESKGNFSVDEVNKDILDDFIKICRDNDISIVAFCSPIYQDFSTERVEFAKICSERNIPFHDYSNDKFFMERPELFWDNAHLNDEGAMIYTLKVIEDLKK